jgi:hypothetical protein
VLEPATARRFLERARLAQPEDIELLLESARCAEALDDVPGAVAFLEQVYDLYPDRPDVERAVGLELMRCGDSRGRKLLERRLAEEPGDKELEQLLARPQAPEPGGG